MQAVITRREAEFRKQNMDLMTELMGDMRSQDNLFDKNMKDLQFRLKGLEKQKADIIKAEDEVKDKLSKLSAARTKLAEQMAEMKEKMDGIRRQRPSGSLTARGKKPSKEPSVDM